MQPSSFSYACAQQQPDLEAQLKRWNDKSLAEVMGYIVQKHHKYCRQAVATIESLLADLLRQQGEEHRELKRIKPLFVKFSTELLRHLIKEEDTLFPYIARMEEAAGRGEALPRPAYGTIVNPVRMMMMEHDVSNEDFKQIRQASNNYLCPPNATPTHEKLYQALCELEQDLQVHSELEDKVLFPRAVALEKSAGSSEKSANGSSR